MRNKKGAPPADGTSRGSESLSKARREQIRRDMFLEAIRVAIAEQLEATALHPAPPAGKDKANHENLLTKQEIEFLTK